MKRIFFVLSLIIGNGLYNTLLSLPLAEKPIVIVITSFNNKDWYQKNLDSVFAQEYNNYHVIYIDDASSDGTGHLVSEYVTLKGFEDKCTIIINEQWESQMANHYKAVYMCDDNAIIAHLDGDDWLAHPNVLSYINKVYSQEDVWLTYGQCETWPYKTMICYPTPTHIIASNNFRSFFWMYGHLRTFYAWLFKKIKLKDFFYNGGFKDLAPSPDLAIMYPMLEMGGLHIRFIPEILYIWNKKNPLSQNYINSEKQMELVQEVKTWNRYQPLNNTLYDIPAKKEPAVSIVCLSTTNSLEQLKAFIQKNYAEIKQVYIVMDKKYFYLDVQQLCNSKNITFEVVLLKKDKPTKTLRSIIKKIQNEFVLLYFNTMNSEIFPITLKECIKVLEDTQAFAFHCNITSNDFNNVPTKMLYEKVFNNFIAYDYRCIKPLYATMSQKSLLLRTQDLAQIFKDTDIKFLQSFSLRFNNRNDIGICCL